MQTVSPWSAPAVILPFCPLLKAILEESTSLLDYTTHNLFAFCYHGNRLIVQPLFFFFFSWLEYGWIAIDRSPSTNFLHFTLEKFPSSELSNISRKCKKSDPVKYYVQIYKKKKKFLFLGFFSSNPHVFLSLNSFIVRHLQGQYKCYSGTIKCC